MRDFTGERDPRIFCGGQALKKYGNPDWHTLIGLSDIKPKFAVLFCRENPAGECRTNATQ